jgi:RNA polymerase sigma-70 factor (ECF subfamily)
MPLVLKEIAGLPLAAIAAVLGLKEATVKTRLHRARLRLRQALEEALPAADGPPPAFAKKVCLDLLRSKQEALDRGVPYALPAGLVCERCSALFATLDLAQGACAELAGGTLPPDVERRLLERLAAAG